MVDSNGTPTGKEHIYYFRNNADGRVFFSYNETTNEYRRMYNEKGEELGQKETGSGLTIVEGEKVDINSIDEICIGNQQAMVGYKQILIKKEDIFNNLNKPYIDSSKINEIMRIYNQSYLYISNDYEYLESMGEIENEDTGEIEPKYNSYIEAISYKWKKTTFPEYEQYKTTFNIDVNDYKNNKYNISYKLGDIDLIEERISS